MTAPPKTNSKVANQTRITPPPFLQLVLFRFHAANRLDEHVLDRHVFVVFSDPRPDNANVVHNAHALDYLAEHRVAGISSRAVETRAVVRDVDEELIGRAVGIIRPGHGDGAAL